MSVLFYIVYVDLHVDIFKCCEDFDPVPASRSQGGGKTKKEGSHQTGTPDECKYLQLCTITKKSDCCQVEMECCFQTNMAFPSFNPILCGSCPRASRRNNTGQCLPVGHITLTC